jgi:hypothetical protein
VATVFRPAVVTRIWPRGSVPDTHVPPNLVLTTLKGKDKFFGPAGMAPVYDWPNPRGAPFPLENRTFLDPSEIWLAGKDKFFGPAGKAPVYDWPNPRGATPSIELRTFIIR